MADEKDKLIQELSDRISELEETEESRTIIHGRVFDKEKARKYNRMQWIGAVILLFIMYLVFNQ